MTEKKTGNLKNKYISFIFFKVLVVLLRERWCQREMIILLPVKSHPLIPFKV